MDLSCIRLDCDLLIYVLDHPADCEWKTRSGNVCVASFDWSCSGVCKSVDRMKDVHKSCGESDAAIWDVVL